MKARRIVSVILGILTIITGVYCLATPAMTYMALGYVVGLSMIVSSIGGIVAWRDRKKAGLADGWSLAGAIVSLVLGVVLVASDAMQLLVDVAIVYVVATWLVIEGVQRVVSAIRIQRARNLLNVRILGSRWWVVLLMGTLMIVVGILSYTNPSGLVMAIGINMGLGLIIAGADMVAVAA